MMEVKWGDTVIVDNVHGGPEQIPAEMWGRVLAQHREFIRSNRPILPGHIMNGPIAIRGALPGDVLEVRIIDVSFRQDWAWNMIMPNRGTLPEDFPEPK